MAVRQKNIEKRCGSNKHSTSVTPMKLECAYDGFVFSDSVGRLLRPARPSDSSLFPTYEVQKQSFSESTV
jgi:hypothetical protein